MEEKVEPEKPQEDTFETDKPPAKPLSAIAHRMFHPPKLERKHSSGDLHSRLKTRKILGVGETDNGDIHRSKISQLLGHNEHLYVKFPRGYWYWHCAMAALYSLLGFNNLLFPRTGWAISQPEELLNLSHLPSRYYGCSALTLALMLCLFWGTSDKTVAKSLLTAMGFCNLLQLIAWILEDWQEAWTWYFYFALTLRILFIVPNIYFYKGIGSCGLRMRKSNSFSNLRDSSLDSSSTNSVWKKAN